MKQNWLKKVFARRYATNEPPTVLFRHEKGAIAQTNDGQLIVTPGSIVHMECLWQRKYGNPMWFIENYSGRTYPQVTCRKLALIRISRCVVVVVMWYLIAVDFPFHFSESIFAHISHTCGVFLTWVCFHSGHGCANDKSASSFFLLRVICSTSRLEIYKYEPKINKLMVLPTDHT